VAAPAISTGIYGFPIELAAPIAVREARHCPAPIEQVTLVAFDPVTQSALQRALEASTD
jgi:O-acetyl-ADP-ribose deacetylase (regulator of RNase III)